jgi:hypothetical protein
MIERRGQRAHQLDGRIEHGVVEDRLNVGVAVPRSMVSKAS